MSAATKAKDKSMASYLKERKVKRTTGTHCPFSCGRPISIEGSQSLLTHMMNCKGRAKTTRGTRVTR